MKKKVLLIAVAALACACGCSKNTTEEVKAPAAVVAPEESVAKTEVKTADKLFGEIELSLSKVQDQPGMTAYEDIDKNSYYFDPENDVLRMILCSGNAEPNGTAGNGTVLENAKNFLKNVSNVYSNDDIALSSEGGIGYTVNVYRSGNADMTLATLFYDGTGKMISANFNPEAYAPSASTYTQDDYINAAIAAVKAEYPDTTFDFESKDVKITTQSDVIRGKVYTIVSFANTRDELGYSFSVYVSAEDLSIYEVGMPK